MPARRRPCSQVPLRLPRSSTRSRSEADTDQRVMAGDPRRVASYVAVLAPSDQVLPVREGDRVCRPLGRPSRSGRRGGGADHDVPAEGVAVAEDRPDEPGVLRVVAERLAQVADEARQRGLAHVGARPDGLAYLRFRDGVRPTREQQGQQVEGLGLEVQELTAVEQLASDLRRRGTRRTARSSPPTPPGPVSTRRSSRGCGRQRGRSCLS